MSKIGKNPIEVFMLFPRDRNKIEMTAPATIFPRNKQIFYSKTFQLNQFDRFSSSPNIRVKFYRKIYFFCYFQSLQN